MAFNFLSLPQAERAEEPAPIDGEERHGYGSFKTSKTSKKSIAADFLPMLSTAGLESDSDDGTPLALEGQFDVLAMACEPPPEAFPGLPTHVILRVLKVTGLPTKMESKGIPGHEGLGFFLHDKGPLERSTASVAVLPQDQTRPGRHRCAEPRVTPKTAGETWEAAWNRDVPGEVKVQLKEGQDTVCAGVLLGQEVVAVTGPIDLTGTLRRFFQNQVLYRPGFSGVAVGMMQDASVYIALELFPAGSQFPPRPFTGEEEVERSLREMQAKQVVNCRFCDGYGRRSCEGCGGHGILVCGTCDGMPALPCPVCRGRGLVHDNLEGTGGPSGSADGEVLSTVRGRRCQNCWGAPLTCKACFGAAALRCNICNGAGWSVCTRCPKDH